MTENKTISSNSSVVKSGNTKQISPSKKWCFTYNNYTLEEYENLIVQLNLKFIKYVIGEEVGECGTPHLQGYIRAENKFRPFSLALNDKIHWEKCKGTEEQNIKYCTKEGKYKTNLKVKKPLKILEDSKLKKWQLEIIDIIKDDGDDRFIYWYWEPIGKSGKTTFTKYLCHKYGAIPIEGKKNDILYCASEFESDIYIFDFERTLENYVSYGAIEKVKNGLYMNSKYESKPIIRNCPHIIIFANFEPDTSTLSLDRWIIKRIKEYV